MLYIKLSMSLIFLYIRFFLTAFFRTVVLVRLRSFIHLPSTIHQVNLISRENKNKKRNNDDNTITKTNGFYPSV